MIEIVPSALTAVELKEKPCLQGRINKKMLEIMYALIIEMFERILDHLRILPLPEHAVIEMATDYGWINRPVRFLTAYAATSGIPSLWKALAKVQRLGYLNEHHDGNNHTL